MMYLIFVILLISLTFALKPTQTIKYPFGCDDTPEAGTDDVNCNMYGHGTHCPLNCIQDNTTCVSPWVTKIPCMPKKEWQCPMHCTYKNGKCIPDDDKHICSIQETSPYCPSYCHMRNGVCVGEDVNYVCKLTWQLQCPYLCTLNTTKQCIPMGGLDSICDYMPKPQCPYHCQYDPSDKLCKPTPIHPRAICEPLVFNKCKNGIAYNVKNCTWPILNICKQKSQIVYPYRFIKKYSFINCAL